LNYFFYKVKRITQSTNKQTKMSTYATATHQRTATENLNAYNSVVSGIHLREKHEVLHQIGMLTNNYKDMTLRRKKELIEKIGGRMMTSYAYVLIPDYIGEWIVEYWKTDLTDHKSLLFRFDFIWYDRDTNHMMIWGDDASVSSVVTYLKNQIVLNQALKDGEHSAVLPEIPQCERRRRGRRDDDWRDDQDMSCKHS
jgi:hypothetical protein